MLLQWHPRNYFDLSSVAPIIVVFLGANGCVTQKYAKVLAKYIAKRGWRCCVIIRYS
jgi:predicted alpha/beta-fold hydrolase